MHKIQLKQNQKREYLCTISGSISKENNNQMRYEQRQNKNMPRKKFEKMSPKFFPSKAVHFFSENDASKEPVSKTIPFLRINGILAGKMKITSFILQHI